MFFHIGPEICGERQHDVAYINALEATISGLAILCSQESRTFVLATSALWSQARKVPFVSLGLIQKHFCRRQRLHEWMHDAANVSVFWLPGRTWGCWIFRTPPPCSCA